MERVFIILTILLTQQLVFGQERNVKPKPIIATEAIGKLTSATGWMLNPDADWVSLKNTIPAFLGAEHNALLEYERTGLGTDNFKYYELKELTYNNTSFYILIKQYRDGYYTYKSIKEGWNNLISHTAYIFNKNELDKLGNAIDGQSNMIEIELIDRVHIQWTSEAEALELIPTKIDWDMSIKTKLILQIAPYKEKSIVQFQIYEVYGKYNSIGGIAKEFKLKGDEYSVRGKQVYLTNELFKYCYYETDYATFEKFLPIN